MVESVGLPLYSRLHIYVLLLQAKYLHPAKYVHLAKNLPRRGGVTAVHQGYAGVRQKSPSSGKKLP